MREWRPVLKALVSELERRSQEVAGERVLPNAVAVALPNAQFERFLPVLQQVTREVGETLVTWARDRRRRWYAGRGPHLTIYIDSCPRLEITCDFRKTP